MSVIVSQERIHQELGAAFDRIDSKTALLHTDLLRIGFARGVGSLKQQLADYFSLLVDVSHGHSLLFPTFNYDFCRTGIYNVGSDSCQVGILNEYARQLYPEQRTRTPIFNFCIYNNNSFSLEAVDNPFSSASTFGEMVQCRAAIVFLGASFSANTFIHHVEEMMDIGYRYLKSFIGVIRFSGLEQQIVVRYRVCPLIEGAVCYDWQRLYLDLLNNGLLHKLPVGNGQFLYYRSDRLLEYWCMRLKEDELYFLTPLSRNKTEDLYKLYGKPLRYESVENRIKL